MQTGRKICCASVGLPDEGTRRVPSSTYSLQVKNEWVNLKIATSRKQKCPQVIFFFPLEMDEVAGNVLMYQEIKSFLAFALNF